MMLLQRHEPLSSAVVAQATRGLARLTDLMAAAAVDDKQLPATLQPVWRLYERDNYQLHRTLSALADATRNNAVLLNRELTVPFKNLLAEVRSIAVTSSGCKPLAATL